VLEDNLLDPDREGLQVSRAMFDAMQRDAKADGAYFILAILPYQHRWWNGTAEESDKVVWRKMVSFVCTQQTSCVDLLPELLKVPPKEVRRHSPTRRLPLSLSDCGGECIQIRGRKVDGTA